MQGLDLNYQANTYCGMVSKSRLMHERVFSIIDKVAKSEVTVLIVGESGTGKELTSRAIHSNGKRGGNLWVPVNCAAIPEGLIESELYGHVRGAYTGAVESRKGKFQEANKGILFLDEVSSMPKDQQPKLLRSLEDMLIYPVGSDKPVQVDVRVIAAANQNLYKAIREGAFREDLYYRLAAVTINMPTLRERVVDIPMLIKYFMEKYQVEYGRIVPDFTPSEYIEYMRYPWSGGNVRELENAVRGIVATGVGKLEKLDELKRISAEISGRVPPIPTGILSNNTARPLELYQPSETYKPQTLKEIKRDAIINALARHDGNRTQAAKELGVHRSTLDRHIRSMRTELGIGQRPETEILQTNE